MQNTDVTGEELSANEKKVLIALQKLGGTGLFRDIVKTGGFKEENEAMNAVSWLRYKGMVTTKEEVKKLYSLGKEGEKLVEKGLPEKRALKYIIKNGGIITLTKLQETVTKDEMPIAVGWLKKRGWATIKRERDKVLLEVTPVGKKMADGETEDEKTLLFLKKHPGSTVDPKVIGLLKTRKNVVEEKDVVSLEVSLSEKGKQAVEKGLRIEEEITQLTSKIIKSGEWRRKKIRPYDINVFAPVISGGKPHPLVALRNRVREIFLSMGFEEIEGNYVESCFWNMDVLFIPQDHPAREMQDTLYCKKPKKIEVDKKLLDMIKRVHEDGGDTGSKGWNYSFSKKEAERVLLRTHTTVNTIRYLYEHPEPPAKIFSIGKVFRRENLDATHLPEFYQIEGIIHEEGANFRQLIGVLKEFYRRMGFEKIRLRPAYFPYTEPSMEVEVFWNNSWMELGGSGIFRPEVTLPAGVKNPVLAWGLGLERLAMLKLGLNDIRSLYISDLQWLRDTPLL